MNRCENRQLAKLLSGFVTGQIVVAKVVVTVAAQSGLHGENDQRLHSSSVFTTEVAAVCLVVFGFLLVPYFDADWRPLVCFGPTNRRSKNIRSRSFRSAMPETSFALVHREPCQVGNRFALFHVSPNVH